MAVPETRKSAQNITKVISVAVVIALCFAAAFLFVSSSPESGTPKFTKTGDSCHLEIGYDREMFTGLVEVTVTDVMEPSVSEKKNVQLTPSGSDKKTLVGDFTTSISGDVELKVKDTVIISVEQVGRLALFVMTAILILIAVMTAIRSFTTSVKEYRHGEDVIVLCNGMMNHEMYVNGNLIGTTKTWLPFMTGYFGGMANGKTFRAYVTAMNVPTLRINEEVVEEYRGTPEHDTEDAVPATENGGI